jgi:hypothetical protein
MHFTVLTLREGKDNNYIVQLDKLREHVIPVFEWFKSYG